MYVTFGRGGIGRNLCISAFCHSVSGAVAPAAWRSSPIEVTTRDRQRPSVCERTLREQNFEMKRGISFEMKTASLTTLQSRQRKDSSNLADDAGRRHRLGRRMPDPQSEMAAAASGSEYAAMRSRVSNEGAHQFLEIARTAAGSCLGVKNSVAATSQIWNLRHGRCRATLFISELVGFGACRHAASRD